MPKRFRSLIIESVTDFVDEIQNIEFTDDVLFRGQREDWALVPKIARLKYRGDRNQSERDMLLDFKHRSTGLIPNPPKFDDDWEWLSIAQHHGMATRFLDWTKSALGALWFATCTPLHKKKDAIVWAFLPNAQKDYQVATTGKPFSAGRTLIYRPKQMVTRIRAQDGWFTCHRPTKNDKYVPLETNPSYQDKLKKFKIPHDLVPDFRADLDRLGINRSSLFPDLDGIASHSQWLHSVEHDEH